MACSLLYEQSVMSRCRRNITGCRARVRVPHQLAECDDVGTILRMHGRELVPKCVRRAVGYLSPGAGARQPSAEGVRRVGCTIVIEEDELRFWMPLFLLMYDCHRVI